MSLLRKVIEWAHKHGQFVTPYDVREAFGITTSQTSYVMHHLRICNYIVCEIKTVPNPNPHKCANGTASAIKVVQVNPMKRSYQTKAIATPHGKTKGDVLRFPSVAEAQRQGFVGSCVKDAAKRDRVYAGYKWKLERIA